ncbi:MAG: flagellar hook protein FlgE [Alphaproteobacteria bacterium]|nr:flagellar hook protein FlgE [Alphaproteobacteria bacterium]
MSLYGAMMTGVAALTANGNALSVASSNIANVNTIGYKTATNSFSTLLAAAAGTSDPASAGVVASSGQNVTQQGLLTSTSSNTDLAISGNGFFMVSPTASATGSLQYTRAGSFTTDASGNLKNANGLYLLGWQLDTSGNPPTNPSNLSLINVSNLSGKAVASSKISLQANLQASATTVGTYNVSTNNMASGAVTPDFQRTVNVDDSQGGTQPLEFSFVKTAANTWAYEVSYQGAATNITGSNPIASGTMTFNADGSLKNVVPTGGSGSPASGSISISIPWSAASGLTAQPLTVNMGTVGNTDGVTQYDTASTLTSANVDGAVYGSVNGLSIATDGTVSANFSNGLSQAVFKIPLATFANPDGLAEVSGNAYTTTPNSGTPIVNSADSGGAGTVNAKELEGSTVDLATEFTNLITTQRAYSAASRIVSTVDQMLQQLDQLPSN